MRYSFSPATSLTVPSVASCSSVKLPPGKDLTMSLKMRAGMTTRPSPSTSAGEKVWIEISMSVADNFNASSRPSRSIPPSNRMVVLAPVDKNVDNPEFLVDEMWITRELSTGQSYPHFYPQVYPQILPLL